MRVCVRIAPGRYISIDEINVTYLDTPRFISQQVGPLHETLGEDVMVNFVPYGFASVG